MEENTTQENSNICQQCGGTIRIEYTVMNPISKDRGLSLTHESRDDRLHDREAHQQKHCRCWQGICLLYYMLHLNQHEDNTHSFYRGTNFEIYDWSDVDVHI